MIFYNQKLYETLYDESMAKWYLKFAWLPQNCSITHELIWLKFGYTCTFRFGGSPNSKWTAWRTKSAHLVALIKG